MPEKNVDLTGSVYLSISSAASCSAVNPRVYPPLLCSAPIKVRFDLLSDLATNVPALFLDWNLNSYSDIVLLLFTVSVCKLFQSSVQKYRKRFLKASDD